MTINKECMKKSLKTDYRNIGIITVICIVFIVMVWALRNLSDQIKAILAIIAQPFTAVNVFIISEVIVIGFLVAYMLTSTPEFIKAEATTLFMLVVSTLIMGFIYIAYGISSMSASASAPSIWQQSIVSYSSPYPDITSIFLIMLTINAFIICPLTVAYARCKE
jgi:uncharacterized protein YacL